MKQIKKPLVWGVIASVITTMTIIVGIAHNKPSEAQPLDLTLTLLGIVTLICWIGFLSSALSASKSEL